MTFQAFRKRMPKPNKVLAVFHATQTPPTEGEHKGLYNWLTFEEEPHLDVKTLQKWVGGNIEMLPCHPSKEKAHNLEAYAQEDGLCDPHFARNDLAGGTLSILGFDGHELLGYAYAGNVIVMGSSRDEPIGLSSTQQQEIQNAVNKYRNWEDEEEQDD